MGKHRGWSKNATAGRSNRRSAKTARGLKENEKRLRRLAELGRSQ